MKAKDVPNDQASLPVEPRTLDQVVARAQSLSRTLLAGKTASVEEFLADRAREAEFE